MANEYASLSGQQKWDTCLRIIEVNVQEKEFQTWFRPVKFVSYDADQKKLTLLLPSNFFVEFLDGQFKRVLFAVIWKVYGNGTQLFYRVEADHTNNITIDVASTPQVIVDKVKKQGRGANARPVVVQEQKAKADDLDPHLNTEMNFENFIEGESNKFPRSIGESIARNPKITTFNPLFIFGHSGVGKTHLLNAIGTTLKALHPEKRVLYLSAHLFQVQYTDSVRNNTTNDFIHFYQTIDVLLIDDVQEFQTKATQNAFFHIFNHLKQNGKQIILSCDRNPSDLQGMEERLITRFKWGLTAELQQPNEELCRKILLNKMRQDGIVMPMDVVNYVAKNVNESVRDLEGVLNSLMAHSVVYNHDIDLSMAQQVVKRTVKFIEKKSTTMDDIIEYTCHAFNVTRAEIVGKTRKANIVEARHVVMYLANKMLDITANRIGVLLGDRNHATVLHGIKQIQGRISMEKQLAAKIETLEENIREHKAME